MRNFQTTLLLATLWLALPLPGRAATGCGEVVRLPAHEGTTQSASLAAPPNAWGGVVLLAGGSGVIDLDDQGCVQGLKGNSLVRGAPFLRSAGLVTILLDAPSDHHGEGDGLGGFRTDPRHAEDIGRVVAEVRRRVTGPVWLVGTSRGTISAANAASRLMGAARPDGVVLTSVLTVGNPRGQKSWVAQTVFDLPLEAVTIPALLVGHANDTCLRTPHELMAKVAGRIAAERKQVVTVTGGPGGRGVSGTEACEGRSPHGFVGQEDEVLAGIVRFIRGAPY